MSDGKEHLRQEGLNHYRLGESIEEVTTKSGVFRLLLAGTGVEVVEGTLLPGKRLTLVPFRDGGRDAVELIYFLDGTVSAERPVPGQTLGPGESLNAHQLREPVILVARTNVRYLYVTSRETFEEMSGKLGELLRLAADVESRDGPGSEHCLRIQQLAFEMGSLLGLSAARLRTLSHAAYLHDVGNTKIPEQILAAKGPLSASDWEIVRRHPIFGSLILNNTYMAKAAPIVEQHHECLDGSGYPHGLAGSEILIESSIVKVADMFDSMTAPRSYRPALSEDEACSEITRFSGVHYLKDVADAFFEVRSRSRDSSSAIRSGSVSAE